MNVAIIPARGGSTRVPGKNIKLFAGKPIICYSIEAAKDSGLFDRIIVSTDSENIAAIAKNAGAEVPFVRPEELSVNSVSMAAVVHHAVTWLLKREDLIEYTCCLMATAPFLEIQFIRQGFEKISKNDVDSVVSMTRFPHSILRAFKMGEDGRMRFQWPEHEFSHSNNLPEFYHDAAQFFWFNTKKFLASKSLMGKEVLPVILPRYMVCDIDTQEDWETAEFMYEAYQKKRLMHGYGGSRVVNV